MSSLTHSITLDQEELERKQAELNELEQELAERELILSTRRRELLEFEYRYQQSVGRKYAELDRLKAEILQMAARLYPDSERFRAQAETARDQSHRSQDKINAHTDHGAPSAMRPTEKIRKLYREAAKKLHPDLTTDLIERERRHALMARLNQAYDKLDEDLIQSVLQEWEEGRTPERDRSIGRRLANVLKKIGQARHRLQRIQSELERLDRSELYRLMQYAMKSGDDGSEVLGIMAQEADEKLDSLRVRIKNLAIDSSFF